MPGLRREPEHSVHLGSAMLSPSSGPACGEGAPEASKRSTAASSSLLDLLPRGLARLEVLREMTCPKPLLAGLAVATRRTVHFLRASVSWAIFVYFLTASSPCRCRRVSSP